MSFAAAQDDKGRSDRERRCFAAAQQNTVAVTWQMHHETGVVLSSHSRSHVATVYLLGPTRAMPKRH